MSVGNLISNPFSPFSALAGAQQKTTHRGLCFSTNERNKRFVLIWF